MRTVALIGALAVAMVVTAEQRFTAAHTVIVLMIAIPRVTRYLPQLIAPTSLFSAS